MFAVRIINLVRLLPKDNIGKHISNQLIRSGTSPGANYEEARGARSTANFIHKLKLFLKELRESTYWLKVIDRTKLTNLNKLKEIFSEAEELSNIIGKSIITAQKKLK